MSYTLEQWREMGELLQVGPYRLFTVDSLTATAGDLPVMLLLHGFPTASWDWHHQWDALAKDYRLIAADMLGFGFSDKPKNHRYRILEQADLQEHLLRHKGVGECYVLAHDYGDTVAQEMLARDNDPDTAAVTLRAVCLLNGGLFPETHRARLAQKLLLGAAGPLLVRLMNKRTLSRNLRAVFGSNSPPQPHELDAFWELIAVNDGRLVMHRLMQYINDRIRYRERWVDALINTRAPVALINGSADPVSGAHMVARYRELVSDQRIVELPGIGHYPQLEAPAQVLTHVSAFFHSVSNQGE